MRCQSLFLSGNHGNGGSVEVWFRYDASKPVPIEHLLPPQVASPHLPPPPLHVSAAGDGGDRSQWELGAELKESTDNAESWLMSPILYLTPSGDSLDWPKPSTLHPDSTPSHTRSDKTITLFFWSTHIVSYPFMFLCASLSQCDESQCTSSLRD